MITKIQKVLGEMIDNKIYSIQRRLSGIFPKSYDNREVPSEEARQIDDQIQSYYANHQPAFVPREMNFNIGTVDIIKDLKWYFETYD